MHSYKCGSWLASSLLLTALKVLESVADTLFFTGNCYILSHWQNCCIESSGSCRTGHKMIVSYTTCTIVHRLDIFLSAFGFAFQNLVCTLPLSCFLGYLSMRLCTCPVLMDVIDLISTWDSSAASVIWNWLSEVTSAYLNSPSSKVESCVSEMILSIIRNYFMSSNLYVGAKDFHPSLSFST